MNLSGVLIAILPVCLFAQSNATDAALDGYIRDESSARITGANVTIRHIDTNTTTSVQTNNDGVLKPEDFAKKVKAPKRLTDPFAAILDHLNEAFSHVEEVYELDKSGALTDKDNQPARELVYERLASGAQLLRDLAYTAWIESEQPFRFNRQGGNPIDPKGPLYNPATGSAPPGAPVVNQ